MEPKYDNCDIKGYLKYYPKIKENLIIKRRNERAKVLHLKRSDIRNLKKFLNNFKTELYPHLSIVIIEHDEIDFDEDFWKISNDKFLNHETIYIQLFSKVTNNSKFYKKSEGLSEGANEFIEISFSSLSERKIELEMLESVEELFKYVDDLKIPFHMLTLQEEIILKILEKCLRERNFNLFNVLLYFNNTLSETILKQTINCENLKAMLLFLNNFTPYDFDKRLLGMVLTISQINDLLYEIARNNENNAIRIMTKHPRMFADFINFFVWSAMRSISHVKNFDDFSYEIQKLETEEEYFKELLEDEEKISENYKDLPKNLKNLHESICNANLERVREFVKKFPDFKFCCDDKKICALEKAIDCKQYEIYSYLHSKGFLAYNKKQLRGKLDRKVNIEIEKFNQKFSKFNPGSFINELCNKCKLFSTSDSEFHDNHEIIRKNILRLSENKDLKLILEFVAYEDFEVIFDFENKSVNSIAPRFSNMTTGLTFCEERKIYIGKDDCEEKQFGVFVHELMHLILYLLYENKCLPYCEMDKNVEKEWNKILRIEKKKYHKNSQNTEEIIGWVFSSDQYKEEYKQRYELAVRPAHIIARYINEPQQVEKISQNHPELFRFFYQNILLDMKNKNALKIIKLNNEFEVIKDAKECELQIEPSSVPNIIYRDDYKTTQDVDSNQLTYSNNSKIILCSNFPELTVQKLIHEINFNSKNNLDLKMKNIFINSNKINNLNQGKIKKIIESKIIERIFISVASLHDNNLNFLTNLSENFKIFYICDENCSLDICKASNIKLSSVQNVRFCFDNLSRNSKMRLLQKKVKFQSKEFKISEIITDKHFTYECFKILASNEIKINCQREEIKNFIERKILRQEKKNFWQVSRKEFYLHGFVKNVQNENVVVISDQAGSGKTTILHKIHEILELKYPKLLTCFVGLKDHSEELSKGVGENFEDFLIKILKFDALEAKIFQEKFSKGEVRILFDAFDEISPKCKEQTLKLFKLFFKKNGNFEETSINSEKENINVFPIQDTYYEHFLFENLDRFSRITDSNILGSEQSQKSGTRLRILDWNQNFTRGSLARIKEKKINSEISQTKNTERKNQILITTRTHLEHDLEKEFKVLAYKLKHLSEKQQIEFLKNIWCSSNKNTDLVAEFAKRIIQKISKMIKTTPSVIGLPLIVEGLGKYFKDKIDESFESEIENLSISFVYGKVIVSGNLDILEHKYPQKAKENSKKCDSIFKVYFYFAICHFFGEEFAGQLGLSYNAEEWPLEEINRGGITSINRNGNLVFNHKTYGEFLISHYFFQVLKTVKFANEYQIKLFIEILTKEDLNVSRMFLNDMLETVEESSLTFFNLRHEKIENFLSNAQVTFLKFSASEGLFNISRLLLEKVKVLNKETYKKIFGANCSGYEEKPFLIEIMPKIENMRKFSSFLDEIFEFYGKKVFEELLFQEDGEGNTIFHYMTNENVNEEIIKYFFDKLLNTDQKDNLKKLVFHQNNENETFLNFSNIKKTSENIFKFLREILNKDDHLNLLRLVFKDLEIFKKIIPYFEEVVSKERLQDLFEELDENSENFLHWSARCAESKKLFKFLWLKIKYSFFDQEKLKNYIKTKGYMKENILQASIVSENENSFFYIFENIFCKYFNFEDFIYECNENGENFLHCLARFGSVSMLEFSFKKLEENLEIEEVKNFIKMKNKKNYNLLHCAAISNSNKNSIKFLLEKIEKLLERTNVLKMFTDKDRDEDTFLHIAVQYLKSKEIFEFLWLKTSEMVENPKEFFMQKGKFDRNILQKSALNQNDPDFFSFAFNLAESFCESEEEKKKLILEKNSENKNLLSLTVSFASKSNLKFLVDKILEIFGENEMKKILEKEKESYGRNLLGLNAGNRNFESIKFLWKVFEENLSREEIFELLNEKNEEGYNFLRFAASLAKSKEIFEFLWLKVEKLFNDEEKLKKYLKIKDQWGKNILQGSIIQVNENSFFYIFENIFCEFFEFKDFIYECDEDGENFLLKLARFGSVSMLEFSFKKLEENLEIEELKNFIKIKSKKNYNLLHCAAISSSNKNSIKFLLELIEKFLGKDEIKKMLNEADKHDYSPLHCVIQFNTSEIFEFYTKLYEENFTKEEIKNILSKKDFRWLGRKNESENMKEIVEKYFLSLLWCRV